MYSKLIFPLDPNDSVLLEIPVIISQGVSQKYRLALDDLIYDFDNGNRPWLYLTAEEY